MQKSHPKVVNPRDVAGEHQKNKKNKKIKMITTLFLAAVLSDGNPSPEIRCCVKLNHPLLTQTGPPSPAKSLQLFSILSQIVKLSIANMRGKDSYKPPFLTMDTTHTH